VSADRDPLVVVGVPVWRGAAFVGETLQSVLAQEGVVLRLAVSVDGGDEASAAACEPFLDDPRVKLIVQPSRLGWVRNASAVLGVAISEGADYACLQPHDDLMEQTYLSSLVGTARLVPRAAAIYSDVQGFGQLDVFLHQQSVTGTPLVRMANLLIDHFNAVAYRGLTPISVLRALHPMSGNPFDDFAADTVWMARLATQGELIRVPRTLYRKRYHGRNTHIQWHFWPRERQIPAWTRHCLDMLAVALTVARDETARRMLVEAARVRLFQGNGRRMEFHNTIAGLSAEERAQVLAEFDSAAARLCRDAAGAAQASTA
jgi:hypothetical protein